MGTPWIPFTQDTADLKFSMKLSNLDILDFGTVSSDKEVSLSL